MPKLLAGFLFRIKLKQIKQGASKYYVNGLKMLVNDLKTGVNIVK
jgi:hypothetical protein